MRLVGWAHSVMNRHVTAPGGLGGQCVDLANVYLMEWGLPPVRANAADWSALRSIGSPHWHFISNAPQNSPSPGDIVVWRETPLLAIGLNGHIAVAMSADPMSLLTLDQNWPTDAPVSLVYHSYTGVSGWWHKD